MHINLPVFFGIHHANLTNEARKRETIGFKSYKNPKYEEKNLE